MGKGFKAYEAAALKGLDENYRALIMLSFEVIFRMNADLSAMSALCGKKITRAKCKPDAQWLKKHIHPEDIPAVDKIIDAALKKKSCFEFEHRILKTDGSTAWMHTCAVPVIGADGKITEWLGASKDITEYKKTREQLKYHAQLIESVNEAILVMDDKLLITYWNKVAEKISGWSADELVGQDDSNELFASADKSVWKEIAEKMEADHSYAGEIKVKRKDGEIIDIDIHIRGIKDECGEKKYSVASFRDITQRINTEKQLISSKEKIELLASIPRRLLESANPQSIIYDLCEEAMEHVSCDLFFNYFVDSRKRRLRLNAYGGVPEETAKSVEWLEYGAAVCGCVAQEGKRIVAECITQATFDPKTEAIAALGVKAFACHPLKSCGRVIGTLAFGTYSRSFFSEDELAYMSTVSDYIAMAMGCLLENRKLKDSERRALRLIVELNALKNELTEEVKALSTLHGLNSKFIIQDDLNSIYKGILEAAVSLTAASKGALLIFNEAEGRLEMIMGYNFSEGFISRFKYTDMETNCSKAYGANKRIVGEDVMVSFAGKVGNKCFSEEGVTDVRSTPLISSSGRITGVLNTYYADKKKFKERELRMLDMLARLAADTIERTLIDEALKEGERKARALVRELEEADRNKNTFLNVLSHELRNPLATIMTGISLIETTEDAGQATQAKQIMRRQSVQLCRLVDDLLDVTRIDQNKIRLKKQRIDINSIIYETAEDYMPRFLEKGVRLSVNVAAEPLCLEADPARITQAAANLLHNSLKFTDKDGFVEISVYRDKNEAVVSVKDSGAGLREDVLATLFRPFAQGDDSLAREGGGLGLGLSISKGIAQLHGGSISVRSEGVNKGSEFIMRLPAALSDEGL